MELIEVFRSAISSVFSNKMRSILTMLGIIIGISSVIMITSIGSGFQASISGEFSKLGMNGIQITVNYNETISDADKLKLDDVDILSKHPQVEYITPFWQSNGTIKLKNPSESDKFVSVGTTADYRFAQPIDVKYGRFLIDSDITNKSEVVLIDEALAKKIFGREDCVGEKVSVAFWFGSTELTVIGVIKTEASTLNSMFSIPSIIYMPITTVMDMYSTKNIDGIYLTIKDKDSLDKTALELNRLLEIKHKNSKKYQVQNLLKTMDSINSVLGSVTAFVGLVAAISLIVGGIGVMNIMLVTVTERTREIGIRKSLGATDGNISFQFLVEAMILTAIGGLIGIILGYAGSFLIGSVVKLTPGFSAPTIIGVFLISSIIGIIFGVYPAYKASRLDPIEALRYE